jgi:hypothetical protein
MMGNMPLSLLDADYFNQAAKDPSYGHVHAGEPVISASGQNLGPMMLPSGEMNPAISYKVFEKMMKKTLEKFITSQRSGKGAFTKALMQNAVTNKLRGDGY